MYHCSNRNMCEQTEFIKKQLNVFDLNPTLRVAGGVAVKICQTHSGGKLFGSTNMILCMSSECTLQL